MDTKPDILFGRCRPRYATRRSPERETLGPRVSAVAGALGKPFMPWQTYVADVSLEIDPTTGLPAYHTVIIIVMRQQGKSELLFPVMTHRAIGFPDFKFGGQAAGPQRIIYTTQTGGKARERWEDVHLARLKESVFKDLFTPRLRLSQEAIMFRNGSVWSPEATTAKTSATGDTIDFAAIDEAWSADKRRELGMRPAMLTRPTRQLWVCSMVPGISRAGTEDSQYLRSLMKKGRTFVDNDVRKGIFYIEFAAQPGADWSSPDTWLDSMPAVCADPVCRCDPNGVWRHTVNVQAVQADFDSMDLVDFGAEYMSWWPKDKRPTWTVIGEARWRGMRDPQSAPAGAVALGVDFDEDRNRAFIAAAGRRSDGKTHIELIEPGDQVSADVIGLDWCLDRVVEIEGRNSTLGVVIDPRGPAQSLIPQLKARGVNVIAPNSMELSGACGRLMDATGQSDPSIESTLRHRGDPVLDLAIAHAEKMISQRNRTFVWDRSAGQAPLFAITLAMHGYEVTMPDDYDVKDSVLGMDGECIDCGKYPDYDGGPIEHYDDCEIVKPSSEGNGQT